MDHLSAQRLIIVAPNGARKTKLDHPRLPITAADIADEVLACQQAGAGMVHLHARDERGEHSLAIKDNAAVLEAVRAVVGDELVIQLTTEAVGRYHPDQQMALIQALRPEAASFALSELIPDEAAIAKAQAFFHWVAEAGIIAQYILYSPAQLQRYHQLCARGVLPSSHHHVLLVLGRYQARQQSHPEDVTPFLTSLSSLPVRWALCAFGQQEQACLMRAAQLGGDVRIGFENNLYRPDGERATDNAAQVSALQQALSDQGMAAMSASTFRALFS